MGLGVAGLGSMCVCVCACVCVLGQRVACCCSLGSYQKLLKDKEAEEWH